jgi:hypothetical protein
MLLNYLPLIASTGVLLVILASLQKLAIDLAQALVRSSYEFLVDPATSIVPA